MDQAIERELAAYEARTKREWSGQLEPARRAGIAHIDRMLLSVGRAAGELINMLIKGASSQRILELGTSYGYSTLWLAEAARQTGGVVVSVDLGDYKQDVARETLGRAGLSGQVEFHAGDALEIIPRLKGGFDFILLDVWKSLYVPCLDLFHPKLAPGATVVADNMLQPASERDHAWRYRRAVRGKPGMTSILLDVGQGLEVSRFEGPWEEGL